MRADKLRNLKAGKGLAGMLVLGVALVGIVPSLRAAKGPACEVLLRRSDGSAVPDMIPCNDCDQNCDEDGVTTANKSCTFMLKTCANQTGEGCPVNLKKKIKAKGQCGAGKLGIAGPGTNAMCGPFVPIKVKTTKNGKKPGKCKIKVIAKSLDKKVKVEKVNLVCNPPAQPNQCPAKTTTTTLPPVCGNGVIETGEVCDPPCQAGGQCTGGMVCRQDCAGCIAAAPCGASCGALTPTQLKFTTGQADVGSGTCATLDGVVTGTVKDNAGATVCNLRAGGLYFGGSGDAVPLPAIVPDMGSSPVKVGCCEQDGKTMQLVATTEADIGGMHPNRTCTSAGVANPEYPKACSGGANAGVPCTTDAECGANSVCFSHDGCLFGPPLPIPNPTGAALSTCVINRIAKNAAGTAACDTGASDINLPLISDLYLTGDLLDGTAPNRPDVPGIQPCPICDPGTSLCKGGPRHGMACTPGNSDVPTVCLSGPMTGAKCATDADCGGNNICNHPYPTSHDCPPPPTSFIGPLSIPFALTTGTSQKVSADLPAQPRVFCGFCGSGVAFHNPPVPCTSDAECAGLTGCGSASGPCGTCKQRDSGAFMIGDARTISETGTPAGALTDHLEHDSTLVSVFCIPPSFNGAVDGTADLPGPGAVALPGKSQLLP